MSYLGSWNEIINPNSDLNEMFEARKASKSNFYCIHQTDDHKCVSKYHESCKTTCYRIDHCDFCEFFGLPDSEECHTCSYKNPATK